MSDLWFGEECLVETLAALVFIGHTLASPLPNIGAVPHRKSQLVACVLPEESGPDDQHCPGRPLPGPPLPSGLGRAISTAPQQNAMSRACLQPLRARSWAEEQHSTRLLRPPRFLSSAYSSPQMGCMASCEGQP